MADPVTSRRLGYRVLWAMLILAAMVALLLPLIRFPRWRYALVSWAVFWILSVVFVALPALRW